MNGIDNLGTSLDLKPDWTKLNRVWPLWALLAAPGVYLVLEKLILGIPGWKLVEWTGILGVAFVLVALVATPVRRLFPGGRIGIWLMRQRRYFGVAGFAYCALHTVYLLAFWLSRQEFGSIVHSFVNPPELLGWIGFAILSLLALTSNDLAVRRLGQNWARLQRWVYLGAPLAVLHWVMLAEHSVVTPAIFSVLLLVIMSVRLAVRSRRSLP